MNVHRPPIARPDRLAALHGSFSDVYSRAEANAGTFYDLLYAEAPELRDIFGVDPKANTARLCALLDLAVLGFQRPEATNSIARDIALENAALGVMPGHYDMIGRALINTLDRLLGPHAFRPFVRESWIAAYETMAVTMALSAHHIYLDRLAKNAAASGL